MNGADVGRSAFRRNLASEFETLIANAIAGGRLPDQVPAFAAAAIVGPRAANRNAWAPQHRDGDLGFRCAR